ncbi:hypothetical protein ACJJTC_000826 [Scirpophaga incertulas]
MDNYMQYRIQGYIKKISMKKGCLPSRFTCQPDRKRSAPSTNRSVIVKRQRKQLIEEALKEAENKETSECTEAVLDLLQNKKEDAPTPTGNPSLSQEKSIQVHVYHKYRSKGIQCKMETSNNAVSPIKSCTKNVLTSPMCKGKLKTFGATQSAKKRLFSSEEGTSIKYSELSTIPTEPEVFSVSEQSQSSESSIQQELLEIKCGHEKQVILKNTLRKIKQRSRFYIGIPDNCYFLVEIIQKQHNIPEEHILLCLKKIRLDSKFTELGDDFGMTWSYAGYIFRRTIPVIANSLRSFIITFNEQTKKSIKLNMPIAFRHKYYSVSCTIDCFEIEIQKPSKAVNQSLTWSEHKKANTLKYLMSCTPDGLINYISPGYNGRISDVQLVEQCNFLDLIPSESFILADRGFKHLEQLLLKKHIKLIRPPSVASGEKLSKNQVRETKQIASIHIHIDRVIRRIREFAMLKLHSILNTNLLSVIDDILIIACALINLQDDLIK